MRSNKSYLDTLSLNERTGVKRMSVTCTNPQCNVLIENVGKCIVLSDEQLTCGRKRFSFLPLCKGVKCSKLNTVRDRWCINNARRANYYLDMHVLSLSLLCREFSKRPTGHTLFSESWKHGLGEVLRFQCFIAPLVFLILNTKKPFSV